MTKKCETFIDLICDWPLDDTRKNLKLNMHFYLMIIIYCNKMIKVKLSINK